MLDRRVSRRDLLLVLLTALGLGACGRKSNLELPDDDEDDGDFLG